MPLNKTSALAKACASDRSLVEPFEVGETPASDSPPTNVTVTLPAAPVHVILATVTFVSIHAAMPGALAGQPLLENPAGQSRQEEIFGCQTESELGKAYEPKSQPLVASGEP